MSHQPPHPLFSAAAVELSCTPSEGRYATAVSSAGAHVASSDAWGRIVDPQGREVLRAPIGFDGRDDRGTNARVYISAWDGTPLGEARVARYSVGPRSAKATLVVDSGAGEVARLEPQDRKGEELTVTAGGRAVGTLRRVAQRGLIRKEADYRLELTGEIDPSVRALILGAAIRYHALLMEAAAASRKGSY